MPNQQQWEKPNDGTAPTKAATAAAQYAAEADDGYNTDTNSVMTDYTVDTYGSAADYYTDSEWGSGGEQFPEWQEFWDESAQAKYWQVFRRFCPFGYILCPLTFRCTFDLPRPCRYNNLTGEASWTRPAALGDDQSVTSSVTAPAGSSDDWVSYIDETTGQEVQIATHFSCPLSILTP